MSDTDASAVVVLGGGIAGIAAALALLDAGRRVTLVEARQFLGGRAFSFTDAATGRPVDNGQHVIVGCCSHFIRFLNRLGVREKWRLQPRLRLPVFDRQGKAGLLAASWLPAPFHLLPGFLTYSHLGAADKALTLAGMLRARFTDRRQPRLERITFYQWLRENGQSERAIQNLWNLVVEPTLNDNVRDVSAAMGLMIVQDGMLRGRHSADLGYPRDALVPSIGAPARNLLTERGARLILGRPARRILLEPGPAVGPAVGSVVGPAAGSPVGPVVGIELASGETVRGQEYVSALPFNTLLGILPPEAAALPFFQDIRGLEWSPIVNLHFRYDRPVMEPDFCAFVDSPLQWVFNQSRILEAADAGGGQNITVSVSAAWDYIDLPREELARRFSAEMAEVFPAAREARVERVIVVKQREATFRCLPGVNDRRPGPRTPIPNLFLAGEWTNTGWPSTMESAVRSGYNVARAIIR